MAESIVKPELDDDGRLYGRPAAKSDEKLIQSGPGTPGGELLRRYWQPIARSDEVQDLPIAVTVLHEDLVLFRDQSGQCGLVYPRCMHRGTNLIYGKIESNGIRCPYHGWLFDGEGHCLEMPCEPGNDYKEKVRQPWYPVMEKYGLVFTYMGPAATQPLFPRISVFEDLPDDEEIVPGGSYQPPVGEQKLFAGYQDFNWWQCYDNFMDPFHVYALHSTINGTQFVDMLRILPEVEFEYTADGVRTIQHRRLEDGRVHQRLSQTVMPNMNCTASVGNDLGPAGVSWTVPVNDTSYRFFTLRTTKKGVDPRSNMEEIGMLQPDWGPDKPYDEWTLEDHQRWQTDYVTQKGQGVINLHSDEHLTPIDTATAMLRRLFKQQADKVMAGENPVGVSFDEPYLIKVMAGNSVLDGELNFLDGYDGRNL